MGNHLINSGRISPNSVAGFTSIDYRLSAHPDHPQDPANTPAASLRDARHPDHIRDVQSAIGFLKEEYGMGEDYVLIGHSAGATQASLSPRASSACQASTTSWRLMIAMVGTTPDSSLRPSEAIRRPGTQRRPSTTAISRGIGRHHGLRSSPGPTRTR